MEKSKIHILIIAPHSGCLLEFHRTCDTRSEEAASTLYGIFKERKIESSLFLARDKMGKPLIRSDIDLNRSAAAESDWYKDIINRINENKSLGLETIILDCHSFPHRSTKMMLFKTPGIFPRFGELSRELNKHLDNRVEEVFGSEDNFITQQATLMGIPSILIEFNEFESVFSRSELYLACVIIVNHIFPLPRKLDKRIFGM